MWQEKKEKEDSLPLMIEDYFKKSKEGLIIAASNISDNIRTNRTRITNNTRKWEKNQQYGYFKRQTDKIFHEET